MVCLGNICINTMHKGDNDDDYDNDNDDDDDIIIIIIIIIYTYLQALSDILQSRGVNIANS